MDENEQDNIPKEKEPLFTDWNPYQNVKLPEGLKYTPPRPREDLRKKLLPLEKVKINPTDEIFLKIALSFLEMGTIEDNFNDNDGKRDKFLDAHAIELGGEKTSLHHFSKKVNKLHGNTISTIVFALSLLGEDFEQKAEELANYLEKIKEERGYFLPEDLSPVDRAAEVVLEQIAGKYQIEI